MLENVLGRNRNTPTQTSLSPEARMANVEGVFRSEGGKGEVTRPEAVRGATVSLVDDIFTTGATINSCARALLKAGAGRVFALTVARA